MKIRVVIVITILALIVIGAWTAFNGVEPIRQPIEFNHKKHTQDLGMDCSDCHRHYENLARAGIPNIEVCAECHSELNGESSAEALVVEHVKQDDPISWRRVNVLPDHVYFSHQRHVKLGRLECSRCHGPMTDLEKPMPMSFTPLKMSWCIQCHESRGVRNDCLDCHR